MTGADDNLRIMLCPTCGSEGRIEYGCANDPHASYVEICHECEGGGHVLVEVEPITMEDLQEPCFWFDVENHYCVRGRDCLCTTDPLDLEYSVSLSHETP